MFHLVRGTLTGRILQLDMPQELRELILGHSNDSMNVQHYGKQLEDRPYEILLEWLTKVDFGLEHKLWVGNVELPEL